MEFRKVTFTDGNIIYVRIDKDATKKDVYEMAMKILRTKVNISGYTVMSKSIEPFTPKLGDSFPANA